MTLNALRPSHPCDERNAPFLPHDERHTLVTTVTQTVYQNGYCREPFQLSTIPFINPLPSSIVTTSHEKLPIHSIFLLISKLPTPNYHPYNTPFSYSQIKSYLHHGKQPTRSSHQFQNRRTRGESTSKVSEISMSRSPTHKVC